MSTPAEQGAEQAVCPYCAGKGGRCRMVGSRFLGTEIHLHEGPWENCWSCGGTGLAAAREAGT